MGACINLGTLKLLKTYLYPVSVVWPINLVDKEVLLEMLYPWQFLKRSYMYSLHNFLPKTTHISIKFLSFQPNLAEKQSLLFTNIILHWHFHRWNKVKSSVQYQWFEPEKN